MTFHPDSLPDLSGKTYIVTGATSGIGFCTAARLAEHGGHIYICARSDAKGRKAVDGIKSLYPNAHLSVIVMDHTSLSSVVSAASEFLSKELALHGLVNNAGIMATPFAMTPDGYEAQWQTNYLAHWVFTSRLLPLMLQTSRGLTPGAVRLVNVTSGGHMMAPKPGIDFSDTSLENQRPINRYGQSKLANVLHAKALHRLYGPGSDSAAGGEGEIWTSAMAPGPVQSDLDHKATQAPLFMKALFPVLNITGLRWPTDKGAWTSVFLAASPEMTAEQSGTYIERIVRLGWESAKAKDGELEKRLEEWVQKEMKGKGWI